MYLFDKDFFLLIQSETEFIGELENKLIPDNYYFFIRLKYYTEILKTIK